MPYLFDTVVTNGSFPRLRYEWPGWTSSTSLYGHTRKCVLAVRSLKVLEVVYFLWLNIFVSYKSIAYYRVFLHSVIRIETSFHRCQRETPNCLDGFSVYVGLSGSLSNSFRQYNENCMSS